MPETRKGREACTHPATDECVHPAIRFLDCETCPPGLCPVIVCVACGEEVDRENGHGITRAEGGGDRPTVRARLSALVWRFRLWLRGVRR